MFETYLLCILLYISVTAYLKFTVFSLWPIIMFSMKPPTDIFHVYLIPLFFWTSIAWVGFHLLSLLSQVFQLCFFNLISTSLNIKNVSHNFKSSTLLGTYPSCLYWLTNYLEYLHLDCFKIWRDGLTLQFDLILVSRTDNRLAFQLFFQ